MTRSPLDDPLRSARRELRAHRWTTVITTASTGVVLVALASRLGGASTIAVAVLAAAAVVHAVRRAAAGDRRWRRATQITRAGRAPDGEER